MIFGGFCVGFGPFCAKGGEPKYERVMHHKKINLP